MQTLSIIQPDDAHLHLRDGRYLARTVADSARYFARAVVMPNLQPPVCSVASAAAYLQRIRAEIPTNANFTPQLALYLTESTTLDTVIEAHAADFVIGFKLYPAGVTTHSSAGVNDLERVYPLFEKMAELGVPLLVHGETNRVEVDVFDREKYFLEDLARIMTRFSGLRIVLEHITTQDAVQFVLDAPSHVAATITVHHLLLNRNHLLGNGIRPHYFCLPILKRQVHQQALIEAATSGNPKFFLGTDSAPHSLSAKQSACGCAGIYSAHAAIELYAQAFEAAGALDKLEGFSSCYAADFYGWSRNSRKITLIQKPWRAPEVLSFGDETLAPLWGGEEICWQVV